MAFKHYFLPAALALLSAGTVRAEVSISSHDGLLSVQANKVPASELATELSNALNISVVTVNGDSDTFVDVDIVDEPLEKALAKLSPNMLVVKDENNHQIIEVVLMFDDENSEGGGDSEQFLPSGSPADEVIAGQGEQPQAQATERATDPASLRDASRAQRVREAAAAASSDPNLPAVQVPPMFAEEGQAPQPAINPETGLPVEQQQPQ